MAVFTCRNDVCMPEPADSALRISEHVDPLRSRSWDSADKTSGTDTLFEAQATSVDEDGPGFSSLLRIFKDGSGRRLSLFMPFPSVHRVVVALRCPRGSFPIGASRCHKLLGLASLGAAEATSR